MHTAVVHLHPPGPLLALVGNPNCGKSALFNLLTGSRQKVANYAGVTVERKEGALTVGQRTVRVLDLPGAYSLYPRSPDERVTTDALYGRLQGERRPDLVVCVVDATRLRRNLRLVFAVMRTGLPCVLALNMTDRARDLGLKIDADALAAELGIPVVETVGVRSGGDSGLRDWVGRWLAQRGNPAGESPNIEPPSMAAAEPNLLSDHERVTRVLARLGIDAPTTDRVTERLDAIVLHPLAGPVLLALVLFLVFQAVFSWAAPPMRWIEAGTDALAQAVAATLPAGRLSSLVTDGLIAGVGSVIVFLPQVLVLFLFILLLEESGYLPRAAFLLDRLMGSVGLSGRSFIPLLSSFACAVPGIMATRTIADPRDRHTTILIAPLMTCSARLPVYALLIGAFVPRRTLALGIEQQALVLLALYLSGIIGAMSVAWVVKRWRGSRGLVAPLMMELPDYHWPAPRAIVIGLWLRATIFMRRVGGIILTMSLLIWVLASFPGAPAGATGAAIEYSFAGRLGHAIEPLFAPIGFDWRICIALIPAMAAREVVISALGTVYALQADPTMPIERSLAALVAHDWTMPTAISLMAWFVFAPQCMATMAAARRESGSWHLPATMLVYLFALAWLGSFIAYRVALLFWPG